MSGPVNELTTIPVLSAISLVKLSPSRFLCCKCDGDKRAGWLETQPATPTTAAHFKEDVSGLFFSVIPEKVRKWSWWPSLLLAQCHQMIHLIKEPIGYNEAWGKVGRWAQSILCCDLSSSSHQGSAVTKEHKDTWRVERFRKAGDPPPHTQTSVRSTSHILSSLTSSFSVTSSSLNQTAHPPLTPSPPVTHLGDRGMETASLRYQPHTRSFSNRFRLMREHLEAQVCWHLEEEGAEWGRVVVEYSAAVRHAHAHTAQCSVLHPHSFLFFACETPTHRKHKFTCMHSFSHTQLRVVSAGEQSEWDMWMTIKISFNISEGKAGGRVEVGGGWV